MSPTQSKITDSYVKVDYTPLPHELKTFPDCLFHYASIHPEREAVVFASTDGSREAVTWKELYHKSCQVARSLITLGVKRYEFVAINIRNCPEWLFLTFGTMIAGARPVSISFTYKDGSDVLALMEKLGTCSLAAVDPGINGNNWEVFNKLIDEYDLSGRAKSVKMPYLRYLICHEFPAEDPCMKTLKELITANQPNVELPKTDPDEIAIVFQTSGSTGVPKVVSHTHASVFATINGIMDIKGAGSDGIVFNDRPFTWMGGFPLSLIYGQTRVTTSGFCPQPMDRMSFLIDVVLREKCSAMVALPPQLQDLMKRKEELKENWPIKTIIVGGQPITRNLAKCIGTVCENLACVYGGTEFCLAAINVVNNTDDFREYACGHIIHGNEVKIVDENGEIVPVNTQGEIYIRSMGLFKDYYNDPEKTRAVKTADGWYKTDDIGRLTEEGVLFVEGRKSNMIISGGMNVAPEILETLIKSCPGVDDVVVVPVSDEIKYQVVCACVVIKTGCDITEEKIRIFCEESHNDIPRLFTVLPSYYLFLEEFPETSTGKTSRKDLVAMAAMKFRKE